ncbi:MAG: hypothetical protein VKI81_07390 [Synechococcaceae cyanobacterium]|nr:hypothetical protein [Synechococcaceae cyanobacterium]
MASEKDDSPTTLVLFGASSLCGEKLLARRPADRPLLCLSRSWPPGLPQENWHRCDLTDLDPLRLAAAADALPGGPQVWLCLAHLWLLAPFLAALAAHHPARLAGLRGVVACSSSSVITKRFATNRHDRDLVQRLTTAQDSLQTTCATLGVPLRILAPTLIHGRAPHHRDRNVETLRSLLRRLPVLPLPATTGLRQPIAAGDLAAVALAQVEDLLSARAAELPGRAPGAPGAEGCLLPVGGDETLPYRQLLERIQAADPRAARCRLLPLPSRLFHFLAAPLLLVSPRTFEAVLRLGADLAGFPSAAERLGREPRPFRVEADP